jgi:hypothetical protein
MIGALMPVKRLLNSSSLISTLQTRQLLYMLLLSMVYKKQLAG